MCVCHFIAHYFSLEAFLKLILNTYLCLSWNLSQFFLAAILIFPWLILIFNILFNIFHPEVLYELAKIHDIAETDYIYCWFSCPCNRAGYKFKSQLFIGIFLIWTGDTASNLLS